jgi:SPP1 gp7 family putative phage head morphogenesis protein
MGDLVMPENIYQQSFWDEDSSGLWDDVAETLVEIYFSGLEGGVTALPPDLRVFVDWDLVNTNALQFAKEYKYQWISKITETTRTQTQKAVSDWIQSGAPLDTLEQVLARTYGPVRAQMIAQTESTRIYAEANSAAWESSGLVEQVRWNTAMDEVVKKCPICWPRNGQLYAIGDTANMPPGHINCRCWITPVASNEALDRRLKEIAAQP